jgi:hypothetical protein
MIRLTVSNLERDISGYCEKAQAATDETRIENGLRRAQIAK